MQFTYLTPAIIVFCSLCGWYWLDAWQYSRAALEQGQWWVLWSGHFAHGNLAHGMINVLGVVLASGLSPRWMNRPVGLWLLGFLCLGVSAALYSLQTDVAIYRGFSGVLHGWMVVAIGLSPQLGERWRFALLSVLLLKLLWEHFQPNTSAIPLYLGDLDGEILVAGHQYGAALGVLVLGALLGASFVRRTRLR